MITFLELLTIEGVGDCHSQLETGRSTACCMCVIIQMWTSVALNLGCVNSYVSMLKVATNAAAMRDSLFTA